MCRRISGRRRTRRTRTTTRRANGGNAAAPGDTITAHPIVMTRHSRAFPVLLLLFLLSGCAALIYEIAWYHMLMLNIGSTAVSLGTLLATYMGGLCIGSAGFSRYRRASGHPLRLYGLIELGVAGFGILVLALVP